jgi:hypothetical protein
MSGIGGLLHKHQLLVVGFLVVIPVWFFSPFWIYPLLNLLAPGDDWVKLGQQGDSYGAANALFSALALGFVALSLWLQSRELESSSKDVRTLIESLSSLTSQLQTANRISVLQAQASYLAILKAGITSHGGKGSLEKDKEELFKAVQRELAKLMASWCLLDGQS